MGNLKKISCDPECGFAVQSHNENEVVDLAMEHVKNMHPSIKATTSEMKKRMITL